MHTPGPWEVVPLPWNDSGCLVTSLFEDPHTGEIICATDEGRWVEYTADDIVRWQANATLISAAPDLLAACEEIRHTANIYQTCDDIESCADCRLLRSIAEMAQAAIAKARGDVRPALTKKGDHDV